jgi:hypothetical protein
MEVNDGRTLRLCRSYSPFFVNREAFLTTSQSHRATKIASLFLRSLLTSDFCLPRPRFSAT